MRRYFAWVAAFVVAAASIGCSDSPSAPTNSAPTPAAAPAPAAVPAPAIPQLGGTWRGTYEYTFNNVRYFYEITTAFNQSGRQISGTWRASDPANKENGEFTGTIVGDGASATVNGTVTITGDNTRGVGACHARASVNSENAVSAASLRIIGPNITLLDCNGNIRGLVWILGR